MACRAEAPLSKVPPRTGFRPVSPSSMKLLEIAAQAIANDLIPSPLHDEPMATASIVPDTRVMNFVPALSKSPM